MFALIPLDLLPLDIPSTGGNDSTPTGLLVLLVVVLVVLAAMVGLLFYLRRRNKS